MAVTARSRFRISVSKRHSWPKSRVQYLESIPESPRSPPKNSFAFELESRPARRTRLGHEKPAASVLDTQIDETLPEAVRTQMQWYSHQLAQSCRDLESLATKVSDLEIVCKSQMDINASLQREIQSWQQNYETVEAELLEASEEINEARIALRQSKTANLNLRYTLCQLKEEQEIAKQKNLWKRLERSWRSCLRWTQSMLPVDLRIGLKRHSGERPPARQDFNDKSRSATPDHTIDNVAPQPIKMRIPSSKQRPLSRQQARPLSSHPPDKVHINDRDEDKQ